MAQFQHIVTLAYPVVIQQEPTVFLLHKVHEMNRAHNSPTTLCLQK